MIEGHLKIGDIVELDPQCQEYSHIGQYAVVHGIWGEKVEGGPFYQVPHPYYVYPLASPKFDQLLGPQAIVRCLSIDDLPASARQVLFTLRLEGRV